MSEPCYCGAIGCPACYPHLSAIVHCDTCDREYPLWHMNDNTTCPDCIEHLRAGERLCVDCEEWTPAELVNAAGMCDYCSFNEAKRIASKLYG